MRFLNKIYFIITFSTSVLLPLVTETTYKPFASPCTSITLSTLVSSDLRTSLPCISYTLAAAPFSTPFAKDILRTSFTGLGHTLNIFA